MNVWILTWVGEQGPEIRAYSSVALLQDGIEENRPSTGSFRSRIDVVKVDS